MKTEKTVDYTADIKHLFNIHHESISGRIMHLLPLLLKQEPAVKKAMVELYVNQHFGFCFPSGKRKFSSEFKSTVKTILKEAILDGFDAKEAERFIYGYVLKAVPKSEV